MLIVNIGLLGGILDADVKYLRGRDIAEYKCLENAWLRVEDGRIHSFGSMDFVPADYVGERCDAHGGALLPSFCDSHTHIVYAGSREGEFVDKINGLTYEEIAKRGGGILNSSDLLARTSESDLYAQSMSRLNEVIAKGTGCIEIKSGYGLALNEELKMLRVIARMAESTAAEVKATFLGAHAVGRAYAGRKCDYVEHVCNDMIPAVAAEGLAKFVDVFCDEGFFDVDDTSRILDVASRYGMKPKIHGNELANSGGVEVAVKYSALSVDHLERAEVEQMRILGNSNTVATCLPGASFFLNMPYAPARKAIENNAILALASDYNPGSSPSGDMRMVVSLGCIKMRLQPEEALNAATINGAYAMDASTEYGSITQGKVANFFITEPLPSLAFLPYAYTTPLIKEVFLKGKLC